MNSQSKDVGFIGLGRMGKPMAINVLQAGFNLTIYDVREEAVRELAALGAKTASSSRGVAESAEIILIAVVDDLQVEDVFAGERGLLEGCRPGSIAAIHSTVRPETVQVLASRAQAKGMGVIDAPISGGEVGAKQKSLCYIVGGESALLDRCREVFATSAGEIFHMGALGSGAAAKLIVQVVTCINMLAAREAESLGEGCDLNFAALQKVLHASSGQSFVMDHWIDRFKLPEDPMEIRRRRTEVFRKSLAPALEIAGKLGLSIPGTTLAERLLPKIMGIEDS